VISFCYLEMLVWDSLATTSQLGRRATLAGKTRSWEIGNMRRSLNLLANCYMRPGEQLRGGHPMGVLNQAGSAALPRRLTAFGGVVWGLCTFGLDPVTAVALVLIATVVLSIV
jgi:hypothetical protein